MYIRQRHKRSLRITEIFQLHAIKSGIDFLLYGLRIAAVPEQQIGIAENIDAVREKGQHIRPPM